MIDIHAHVLPGIDDGPSDLEGSMELIRQGYRDGIRGVVCTSHVLDELTDETERIFRNKFRQLQARIKEEALPVTLWLGSEIHCQTIFDPARPLATLNGNGKYLLIELPLSHLPSQAREILFNLSMKGITPILAHPERNGAILENTRLAWEFVRQGVLLQINAGSITGRFGRGTRKLALTLLDHNLVSFVASDCHRASSRPLILSKAREIVTRRWGRGWAEVLFELNPYRAVQGMEIDPPEPVSQDEKVTFLRRLFRG